MKWFLSKKSNQRRNKLIIYLLFVNYLVEIIKNEAH